MSGALVSEDEGVQKSVYYISRSMNEPQTGYQRLKMLLIAFFINLRKFKHYFQTFLIMIFTEHPLRSVTENSEVTGQILKWASELRSYALRYELRTTIKW